jgi:large subunit ribosomal protein L15
MKLDSLKPPAGSRKKPKRIGRGEGSGHGGTATKGSKGQNARSGGKVRTSFEGGQMPLARRLPKRGFRNPFRVAVSIVNVVDLKRFSAGSVVGAAELIASGLVKRGDPIKVLGKGEIDYPLSLKVKMISRAAKEKIEAAGGSVEVD